MPQRRNTLIYFITLCTLLMCTSSFAQEGNGLIKNSSFFVLQQKQYELWLERHNLNDYLEIRRLRVESDQLTLYIQKGSKLSDCDALRDFWINYSTEHAKQYPRDQRFHAVLFNTWSFFVEVEPDSLQIVLECPAGEELVRIYGESDRRIVVEESFDRKMGNGVMEIALSNLYAGECLEAQSPDQNARFIRQKIGKYIEDWYKAKGTDFWFDARLRIDEDYFSEFTYVITHLENEIIQEDYFEYHRINIKVVQMGDRINIIWDFRGKYGAGVFTTPRESEYKPIDNYYPGAVAEYEARLLKHIQDHLRRS